MNLVLTVTRYVLVLIGVGLSILLFSGPTVADGKAAMTEFRESGSMTAIYYWNSGGCSVGFLFISNRDAA